MCHGFCVLDEKSAIAVKNGPLHSQSGLFGQPGNGLVLGCRFDLPQNRLEMRLVRLTQETVVRQFDDCPAGRFRRFADRRDQRRSSQEPLRASAPKRRATRPTALVAAAVGKLHRVLQHPEGLGFPAGRWGGSPRGCTPATPGSDRPWDSDFAARSQRASAYSAVGQLRNARTPAAESSGVGGVQKRLDLLMNGVGSQPPQQRQNRRLKGSLAACRDGRSTSPRRIFARSEGLGALFADVRDRPFDVIPLRACRHVAVQRERCRLQIGFVGIADRARPATAPSSTAGVCACAPIPSTGRSLRSISSSTRMSTTCSRRPTCLFSASSRAGAGNFFRLLEPALRPRPFRTASSPAKALIEHRNDLRIAASGEKTQTPFGPWLARRCRPLRALTGSILSPCRTAKFFQQG